MLILLLVDITTPPPKITEHQHRRSSFLQKFPPTFILLNPSDVMLSHSCLSLQELYAESWTVRRKLM